MYSIGSLFGGQSAAGAVKQAQAENLIPHKTQHIVALTDFKEHSKQRRGPDPDAREVMLKLTFTVQEGQFRGRNVYRYIGVDHSNPQYMSMSRKFMGQLAVALGLGDQVIDNLEVLMNKPVTAIIVQTKESGNYGAQNDIDTFKAAAAVGPAAPAAPMPQQTFQAPPTLGPQPGAVPQQAYTPQQQATYAAPAAAAPVYQQPAPTQPAVPASTLQAGAGKKPWEK